MRELLLVRYGEIFLKGQNRPVFMRALVKRVKRAVQDLGATVYLNDSRIFVTDYTDQDEAIRKVTKQQEKYHKKNAKEEEKRLANA